MIRNKHTFFIGIFIILVWVFFGIPNSWKISLTIISAIYLLFISVRIELPKRGINKRIRKKEKITPVFVENSPLTKVDGVIAPNKTDKEENEIS